MVKCVAWGMRLTRPCHHTCFRVPVMFEQGLELYRQHIVCTARTDIVMCMYTMHVEGCMCYNKATCMLKIIRQEHVCVRLLWPPP